MSTNHPRARAAHWAPLTFALLAAATLWALMVQPWTLAATGGASVWSWWAVEPAQLLEMLRLNENLARALPMLATGFAASVLGLLALATTLWRRTRNTHRAVTTGR